jgi:sugar lactone lactonase YvrE
MRRLAGFVIFVALASAPVRPQDNRGVIVNRDVPVGRRLALVIGNAAYAGSPLRNSLNDARDMAAALEAIGFSVTTELDLTRRRMDEVTAQFASKLRGGDLALFYYAGHGIQYNQENYLLPVDFTAASPSDVQYNAVPAAQIRDRMEESGARVRILILDACRDNPFRLTRGGAGGLAAMSSQEGTLIAYATADNSTADDGALDRNGLYTRCLLESLRAPGVTLKRWFETTRDSVWEQSHHRQRPVTYDGIVGDLALAINVKAPKVIATIAPAAVTAPLLFFTTIESFAGRNWKIEGDGKPATEAPLGHIYSVACDRDGNIYATDSGPPTVFKIDTAGRLHVLLGLDPRNQGPAAPRVIAVDSKGAVYVAGKLRIFGVLPNGDVRLIAGVDRGPGFTPDGALASGAVLNDVNGIAVAPDGTIAFSELGSNRVRRIDAKGRLGTIAGDGQARFAGDGGPAQRASLNRPMQIAFDSQGDLFIADRGNGRVRKVTPQGVITTLMDGIGCPMGVAVDTEGDLFVSDPCERRVYKVPADGGTAPSVVAGRGRDRKEPDGVGGPAYAASLDEWGLAVNPQNELLISGPDNGYIYKIGRDGIFSIVAGNGNWRAPTDGMKAADAEFQLVLKMAVDPKGALAISDQDGNRIYRIQNGTVNRLAGFPGTSFLGENILAKDSGLNRPEGIRFRPNGAIVFVDASANRIREIGLDGKVRTIAGNGRSGYSGDGGAAVNAVLNGPFGLCLDADGAVFFIDRGNHRVRKITRKGDIELVAGNGTAGFSGDGGPADRAALNMPAAVEVGPDGSVYIADSGNHRVRKVSPDGVISTIAGDGQARTTGDGGLASSASINWPFDLAFGPDHALYIVDRVDSRIRRINLGNGRIDTVAGTGEQAFSPDGRPAAKATLNLPNGLAFDADGNLYVSENEGRIRIIRASGARRP